MQISKINSTNFGATPDFATRKLLLNAKLDGVNTDKLENLMKEIYADKYIMINYTNSNNYYMGIFSKNDGYAELKQKVTKFSPKVVCKHPELFIKYLTKKFEKLKQTRNQKQIFIDELENKFGRYDESYRHSGSYSN